MSLSSKQPWPSIVWRMYQAMLVIEASSPTISKVSGLSSASSSFLEFLLKLVQLSVHDLQYLVWIFQYFHG